MRTLDIISRLGYHLREIVQCLYDTYNGGLAYFVRFTSSDVG